MAQTLDARSVQSVPWAAWQGPWGRTMALADVLSAALVGAAGLGVRQAQRLAGLVAHARAQSPYYAYMYRDLPLQPKLTDLPVVTRSGLMAHFDQWATDPQVTQAGVEQFLSQAQRVGRDYLGRYGVSTSSGTCGQRGVFLQPDSAQAIYDALLAVRCHPSAWAGGGMVPVLPAVLIAAIDGHYAGIATWRRLKRSLPWIAEHMPALSVLAPLERITAQLNQIQPKFLSAYPSVLHALAEAQNLGRLHIQPTWLWSGGECLLPGMKQDIEKAFGCPLINDYGASECASIAFECAHGRMHLNADWVVLEPVDQQYRPVMPGCVSHTVLLTNLANTVQPLIRYDLGDRMTAYPDECACGSVLPSFMVTGRVADVLRFERADGSIAVLFPLALQTVIEEGSGVTMFQIEQTAPRCLSVRVGTRGQVDAPAQAPHAVEALKTYLAKQGLETVQVHWDPAPLRAECNSGKLRQIVALNG